MTTTAAPAAAAPAAVQESAAAPSAELMDRVRDVTPVWVRHPASAGRDARGRRRRQVVVVSYNMLAQHAISRSIFGYCSSQCLKMKYRRQVLLRELCALVGEPVPGSGAAGRAEAEKARATRPVADVLCLQEVDDLFFRTYWEPQLASIGFRGLCLPKGWPDHSQGAHGCAIFWRESALELADLERDYERVDFRDCAEGTTGTEHEELYRRGVAQLLALRWRQPHQSTAEFGSAAAAAAAAAAAEGAAAPGEAAVASQDDAEAESEAVDGLLLATTHLFFSPRYEFTRMRQSELLLARAVAMQKRLAESGAGEFALVMTGDFNACPDTACYEFLTGLREWDERRLRRQLLPKEHGTEDVANLASIVADSNDGTLVANMARPPETPADHKRIADTQALLARAREEFPVLVDNYIDYLSVTGQPPHPKEPDHTGAPFTTVGAEWMGTLDYIFTAQGSTALRPTQLLRIPDLEVAKVAVGLPNDWRGSDHVPVGVAFEVATKGET